jgi:hypothetical protein
MKAYKVETSRLSHFPDSWLTDGGDIVSLKVCIDCVQLFVGGKLIRLFTIFMSSIEAWQCGIDSTRQNNERCLARQPCAIDTHLYALAALYPQEDFWYSFLLEAELTPGP